MASQPKGQKIEIRPISGLGYNRGGHRWGPGWTAAPPQIVQDQALLARLQQDANLEIKVDGKISHHGGQPRGQGVFVPDPGAPVEDQLAAAHARITELEGKIASMHTNQAAMGAPPEAAGEGQPLQPAVGGGAGGAAPIMTPDGATAGSHPSQPPPDDKGKNPKAK